MTSIRSAKHAVQSKQTSHTASAKGKKKASAIKKKAPAKAHTPHQTSSFGGTSHANGKNGASHAQSAHSVHANAPHIPNSWHKYSPSEGAETMKKISDEAPGLTLELGGGKSANVSGDSKDYAALVKNGTLTLYKNPKEERGDPPDDGPQTLGDWYPGYHLTLNRTGPLATVASQIDSLVASGQEAGAKLDKGMEKFHNVVHAARVNNMSGVTAGSPQLAKIKDEIRAATPDVEKVVSDFEAAHAKWSAKAKDVESGPLSADEKKFLTDVLTESEPKSQGGLGIKIEDVKNIITTDKAILSHPEVLSVDPGFDGLRINVDANSIVKGGQTLSGYTDELVKQLKQKGVTGGIGVEREMNDSGVQQLAVKQILEPALGANIVAQTGEGNDELSFGFHAADFDRAKPFEAKVQAFMDAYQPKGRHAKVVFEKVSY